MALEIKGMKRVFKMKKNIMRKYLLILLHPVSKKSYGCLINCMY